MPKMMAAVHPRFATPHVAILVFTACSLLLALFGGFRQLAVIASASLLIIHLGSALSTLKLRRKESLTSEKSFWVPGGPLIPLLAAGVIGWLLSNLSTEEQTGITLFIALFTIIYFITKYLKKRRSMPAPPDLFTT